MDVVEIVIVSEVEPIPYDVELDAYVIQLDGTHSGTDKIIFRRHNGT